MNFIYRWKEKLSGEKRWRKRRELVEIIKYVLKLGHIQKN